MQSTSIVTSRQIRTLEGPYLTWHSGNENASAKSLSAPEKVCPDSLAFINNSDFLATALEHCNFLVVDQKISLSAAILKPHQALWTTPSVRAAMALILPLFDPRFRKTEPLVSEDAHIHPTAKIGPGTRILAGAVIEEHAEVGAHCLIHSGAVVSAFCRVGDRCILHANSVVGSDGFGFVTDPKGIHHKIPQVGIAVLENDVELGAGTVIDRATLFETRICTGTKIDNLCHIAHNCKVGKHGVIAAGFFLAGSSEIGDHFMTGGGSVVADHVKICDRVTLGGRSAVTKDITEPGAYAGYPLEPLKDNLRTTQNLKHLSEMRRQLNQISKKQGAPDAN